MKCRSPWRGLCTLFPSLVPPRACPPGVHVIVCAPSLQLSRYRSRCLLFFGLQYPCLLVSPIFRFPPPDAEHMDIFKQLLACACDSSLSSFSHLFFLHLSSGSLPSVCHLDSCYRLHHILTLNSLFVLRPVPPGNQILQEASRFHHDRIVCVIGIGYRTLPTNPSRASFPQKPTQASLSSTIPSSQTSPVWA